MHFCVCVCVFVCASDCSARTVCENVWVQNKHYYVSVLKTGSLQIIIRAHM